MAQSTALEHDAVQPIGLAPIPLKQILPWGIFFTALTLVLLYLVGVEQGATALFSGSTVHEFVHDGRHLLGFPCH